MGTATSHFLDLFWSEQFWLPGNKWESLENVDDALYYPKAKHLGVPCILTGLVIVVLRYFFERYCVYPFAARFGLKEKKLHIIEENKDLEKAFNKSNVLDKNVLLTLTKKTGLSERKIERWFRFQRNNKKIGTLQKFKECSFHFTFYIFSFWFAIWILWDKPWFWDLKQCWEGWPKQPIDNGIYWYYFIELSFYWSLVFTVLYDNKRSDFTEMIVHHIVTIFLMYFSWTTNFVRIGTWVLLVHDAADYWMAGSKMAHYIKFERAVVVLFVIFLVVWIVSRLVIFPFWVIHSASIHSLVVFHNITSFSSWHFFNGLLYILQILHIIWSWIILKIFLRKFTGDGIMADVRSDTEESEEESVPKQPCHSHDKFTNGVSCRK